MITPTDSPKVDGGAITDEQLGVAREIPEGTSPEESMPLAPPTATDTTAVLDGPLEEGRASGDGEAMENTGASIEDDETSTHGRSTNDQVQTLEPPQEVTEGRRRVSATAVRVTPQVVHGSEGSEASVAGSGSEGDDMRTEGYDQPRSRGRGMMAAGNHIQNRTAMRVRQFGEDSGLAREIGLDTFGSAYVDDEPAGQSRLGSVEDVVDQQLDVTTALHENYQEMNAKVEKLAEALAVTTERLTALGQEATFFRQRDDLRFVEQQDATKRMFGDFGMQIQSMLSNVVQQLGNQLHDQGRPHGRRTLTNGSVPPPNTGGWLDTTQEWDVAREEQVRFDAIQGLNPTAGQMMGGIKTPGRGGIGVGARGSRGLETSTFGTSSAYGTKSEGSEDDMGGRRRHEQREKGGNSSIQDSEGGHAKTSQEKRRIKLDSNQQVKDDSHLHRGRKQESTEKGMQGYQKDGFVVPDQDGGSEETTEEEKRRMFREGTRVERRVSKMNALGIMEDVVMFKCDMCNALTPDEFNSRIGSCNTCGMDLNRHNISYEGDGAEDEPRRGLAHVPTTVKPGGRTPTAFTPRSPSTYTARPQNGGGGDGDGGDGGGGDDGGGSGGGSGENGDGGGGDDGPNGNNGYGPGNGYGPSSSNSSYSGRTPSVTSISASEAFRRQDATSGVSQVARSVKMNKWVYSMLKDKKEPTIDYHADGRWFMREVSHGQELESRVVYDSMRDTVYYMMFNGTSQTPEAVWETIKNFFSPNNDQWSVTSALLKQELKVLYTELENKGIPIKDVTIEDIFDDPTGGLTAPAELLKTFLETYDVLEWRKNVEKSAPMGKIGDYYKAEAEVERLWNDQHVVHGADGSSLVRLYSGKQKEHWTSSKTMSVYGLVGYNIRQMWWHMKRLTLASKFAPEWANKPAEAAAAVQASHRRILRQLQLALQASPIDPFCFAHDKFDKKKYIDDVSHLSPLNQVQHIYELITANEKQLREHNGDGDGKKEKDATSKERSEGEPSLNALGTPPARTRPSKKMTTFDHRRIVAVTNPSLRKESLRSRSILSIIKDGVGAGQGASLTAGVANDSNGSLSDTVAQVIQDEMVLLLSLGTGAATDAAHVYGELNLMGGETGRAYEEEIHALSKSSVQNALQEAYSKTFDVATGAGNVFYKLLPDNVASTEKCSAEEFMKSITRKNGKMPRFSSEWTKFSAAMMQKVEEERKREGLKGVPAKQMEHVRRMVSSNQKSLDTKRANAANNQWGRANNQRGRGNFRGGYGGGGGGNNRGNPNQQPVNGSRGYGGKSKYMCYDLKDHGRCRFGDSCKYSHDPAVLAGDDPRNSRQQPYHGREPNARDGIAAMLNNLNLHPDQVRELADWAAGSGRH